VGVARFEATVSSTWDVDTAFAYMADFSHSAVWDPGVTTATRVGDGDVALGSRFDLVTSFNGRTLPLTYEVTTFDAPRRVVLSAETPLVRSVDEITISPRASGSTVTYVATLTTRGWLRLFTPLVARVFQGVGEKARAGLERELTM
jgi:hypothetical protein